MRLLLVTRHSSLVTLNFAVLSPARSALARPPSPLVPHAIPCAPFRQIGAKVRIAECLEVLGEIAYAQGQFAEGEACFRQQLAIVPDLGYRELLAWSYTNPT